MSLRFSVLVLAILPLAACSKMDPQDCKKLRDGAFEMINVANNCSSDADCHPTEWPGCKKPVNTQSFDKIHQMMESFHKGKCEETLLTCKETPPTYCAEGICAFRYKSAPGEGMRLE